MGSGNAVGGGVRVMPAGRFVRVWALVWAVLVGVLFTAVTALTLAVWFADPGGAVTNPVLDLSFFALGALLTVGLTSQVRRRSTAGIAQALVAAASMGGAGLLGRRIEPAVGGGVLILVAAVLLLGRRPRSRPVGTGTGIAVAGRRIRILLVLAAALAAIPSGVHAWAMLGAARAAGPSCFLGRCATGDRLAEAAALALAILLLTAVAAAGPDGWPLCCWSAGLAAVLLGAVSILQPLQVGSLGSSVGIGAVLWGASVIVIGQAGRTTTERTLT